MATTLSSQSGSPDLSHPHPSSGSCPGKQAVFQSPGRAVGFGPEDRASSMQEVGPGNVAGNWGQGGPWSCRGFLPGLPCLQRASLLVGQEGGEQQSLVTGGQGRARPSVPVCPSFSPAASFLPSLRAKGLEGWGVGGPTPSPRLAVGKQAVMISSQGGNTRKDVKSHIEHTGVSSRRHVCPRGMRVRGVGGGQAGSPMLFPQ